MWGGGLWRVLCHLPSFRQLVCSFYIGFYVSHCVDQVTEGAGSKVGRGTLLLDGTPRAWVLLINAMLCTVHAQYFGVVIDYAVLNNQKDQRLDENGLPQKLITCAQ